MSAPGDDQESGELVIFDKDDLYIHEVFCGDVDLRILLRPGVGLNVMMREMTSREKTKFKPALNTEAQGKVEKVAEMCFLGTQR
jgi:hypothetical protein